MLRISRSPAVDNRYPYIHINPCRSRQRFFPVRPNFTTKLGRFASTYDGRGEFFVARSWTGEARVQGSLWVTGHRVEDRVQVLLGAACSGGVALTMCHVIELGIGGTTSAVPDKEPLPCPSRTTATSNKTRPAAVVSRSCSEPACAWQSYWVVIGKGWEVEEIVQQYPASKAGRRSRRLGLRLRPSGRNRSRCRGGQ